MTARLAGPFLADAIDRTLRRVDGLTCQVVASDNSLLGPTITVAGLLSGADMIDALKRAPESNAYLLPAAAFNEDSVTIDGMSLSEIADGTGRENVVATDDIVGSVLNITGGAVRDAATAKRAVSNNTTRGRESGGRIPSEEGK
ncbi:MAG: DUF512 domain-containing protein [Syntrophales bacterium]|nr:DUF512 domain-containing protein [Syntrophales bacterium]